MSSIRRSGRGIRRLVTLHGTIRQLVAESDRRLLDSLDDEDDGNLGSPEPPQDPEELARRYHPLFIIKLIPVLRIPAIRHDRDWCSFQALVKLIPGFKRMISEH